MSRREGPLARRSKPQGTQAKVCAGRRCKMASIPPAQTRLRETNNKRRFQFSDDDRVRDRIPRRVHDGPVGIAHSSPLQTTGRSGILLIDPLTASKSSTVDEGGEPEECH